MVQQEQEVNVVLQNSIEGIVKVLLVDHNNAVDCINQDYFDQMYENVEEIFVLYVVKIFGKVYSVVVPYLVVSNNEIVVNKLLVVNQDYNYEVN